MAYQLDFSISLGASYAGIADLRAQLVDTAGANVGAAVSTGFVDMGTGTYLWDYASFPDDHRGGVKFYSNAAAATTLAFSSINPQEAEYTDVETSSRLSPTVAGRTLDVSAAGESGVDWANIGSPTTVNNLSGTTVKAVTDQVSSNVTAISGDATAADNLEAIMDGTGADMTLTQLRVNASNIDGGIYVTNDAGNAITAVSTAGGKVGMFLNGSGGHGLYAEGGAGDGIHAIGVSGEGVGGSGIYAEGDNEGLYSEGTGVVSGVGAKFVGGSLEDMEFANSQATTVATAIVDNILYSEPGQENPSAAGTLIQKIRYIFKAWRNKTTQTSSQYSLFADDGTTVDQKASASDDGTTFTRAEIGTGP